MSLRYVLNAILRRPIETLAAAVAVAVTVALLASLGSFVDRTSSRLTVTAAARVPVDWQVQLTPNGDLAATTHAISAVPGLQGSREVDYLRVPGLVSTGPAGTRTTGAAFVVSIPQDYSTFAPGEVRALLGPGTGVSLQQQTAANLSAGPGSSVRVLGSNRSVTVQSVVDLRQADSFFQVVGAPVGSGAAAPPDNVLLVPPAELTALAGTAPVVRQLHVRLDHGQLPHDPAAAADLVTQRVNHLVVAVSGGALVGDNLAVALSAAREDALYARLLVLLLGIPGLVLAGVVAALVVSMRNERQRRDLGLLRLRGATPGRQGLLVGAVALVDGLLGAAIGAAAAIPVSRLALDGKSPSTGWLLVGSGAGLLLALLVELGPLARLLRGGAPTVAEQVTTSTKGRTPLPLRLGLDVVLLGGSLLTLWLTSRNGYKVVVVPEGVPVASVDYGALLAPALAWPGGALLVWRLTALALRRLPSTPARDPHGRLGDLRRAVLRHRRRLVARGAMALALAVGITLSAAVFTATYDRQARVDVALTVGSDVAVTVPPDSTTGLSPGIAKVPGAQAVEQVSHRLAYVGPDLQDLYGIDPKTIGRAAPLQNAFTPGSSVTAVMRALASTPDGALLSQETLHDYQLHTGDPVRLRLQDASNQYRTVTFHVVGVVTEFATAPRDSFIVANRGYVAQQTGRSEVQTLLVRTSSPAAVAARISPPPGATVADTSSGSAAVTSASGLAAGSLTGLSRLLLGFGLVLATASTALVLASSATARRPALTALSLLGASARQGAGFLWTESRAMVVAGIVGGAALGGLLSQELLKVLTGIFDPAPEHAAIPWSFVAGTIGAVVVAAVLTTGWLARSTSRVDPSRLRD
jgi:putative ABC transport system permease protein